MSESINHSHGDDKSNAISPASLVDILELGRLARNSEGAAALQFQLVNQTYKLAPYDIAILWRLNEGVVAQSGTSKVERNAPFVIWVERVCKDLSKQESAVRVDPSMLSPDDAIEWDTSLPSHGIWIPVGRQNSTSGLLLCRSYDWTNSEILLCTEWVDIWSHAWQTQFAPTLHGEIHHFFKKISNRLPNQDQILKGSQEIAHGFAFFVDKYLRHPFDLLRLIRSLCTNFFRKTIDLFNQIKTHGIAEQFDRIKLELRAIWADKKRRISWIAVLVMSFPVRLSVLAPAELVPGHPAIIRVPIEGVVDEFFVTPNQQVAEGQPLFKLDLTTLTSRFNVAQQETQVAASEYRQSALQSLTDAKSRTQLVPQEGKAAERKVETDYLRELIAKAQIKAPRAGTVLFDDPSEWIGKPVAAGEKVMVVATEGDAEIEAWVPVSDAIQLPPETPVTLYLNAAPLSPVDGHLRFIGHEALQRPDGSYAYRLRATLDTGQSAPRVGLKGTAKISGEFVPLVYWVLRKPLGTVRQFLGI